MALEQDIGALIASTNQLTAVVDNKAQALDKQMAALDARVAKKEQEVDKFLQEALPETRYVQDIFIGGSKDYLYPVWWTFPGNSEGVSKLTISREYGWNGGAGERPLNPASVHQAGLILELEGNSSPWSGNANFLQIKRFNQTYNSTVSHVNFMLECKAEKVDPNRDHYGGGSDGSIGPWCRTASGVYLRGGGLKYRIIKNWKGDVRYFDGSSMERKMIYEYNDPNASSTARWFIEPIPFTERKAPIANTIPYVNHPYTPPATA
ncbi:phage tail protein [Pseudoalteromonas xiamenensis]|uniref:phage tail protein n=1 Tax=Pseudoalteromonas xiamenensis TaxID=882626 RepID=UPI0035EDB54C